MTTKAWLVRPARSTDQKLLEGFVCADPAFAWQRDVEQFINDTVWRWASDRFARAYDPRLLLLFHRKPRQLLGVVAHERAPLLVDGREIAATKLEVLAVARAWQGRRFATGERVSDVLMSAALTDVGRRVPPRDARVYAIVHEANTRSARLCERHGMTLELERSEDWPHLRRLMTPGREP